MFQLSTADEYRIAFRALTVPLLRARAEEAGVVRYKSLNKAQLVECIVARCLIEDAHAEAVEIDERRTIARAFLSTPVGVVLTDDEIDAGVRGAEAATEALIVANTRSSTVNTDPAQPCTHGIEPHKFCQSCSDERPAYAAQVDKIKAMRALVLAQQENA